MIRAVDDNQDLLRISIASAGNDHRLGANEAPPAIISLFVGDELEAVLKSIRDGTPYNGSTKEKIKIGVDVLPPIPKDTTDRNRTSPFAFTGNKFEFRSVGSSLSISGPMTTLNAIVADVLKEYADKLDGASDFESTLQNLIKKEITAHWKIIFNGNGYDASWVAEAKKRGLLNLRNLPEAVAEYLQPKNVKLFTEAGIYSESEMRGHYEVKLEKYCNLLNIEVETMLGMIHKNILPCTFACIKNTSETVAALKAAVPDATGAAEVALLKKLDALADALAAKTETLAKKHEAANSQSDCMTRARQYAQSVVPAMEEARTVADEIELLLGESYKPFPSYEELLFSV